MKKRYAQLVIEVYPGAIKLHPHCQGALLSLIDTESAWIKYRDTHCNEIYESTLPGEEAEIEKMGCLISLTSSRLVELFHLDTGVSGDGFYNALSFISIISSKKTDEILLHIENLKQLPEESYYHKKNCELTRSIYNEDERLCRARLKLQSRWIRGYDCWEMDKRQYAGCSMQPYLVITTFRENSRLGSAVIRGVGLPGEGAYVR